MTPERWAQIERLYHEAIQRTSSERLQLFCAPGNAGIAQIFSAMGDLSKMMNETMASIEATSGAASRLESVSSGAADVVKSYRVA